MNTAKNMSRSKAFSMKVSFIQTSSESEPKKGRNCESVCASSPKESEKNIINKRLNGNHIDEIMIIYFGIETENNRLFWSKVSKKERAWTTTACFSFFTSLGFMIDSGCIDFIFRLCLCVCMFARGCYCCCFYFCDGFVWSFKQTSTKCWKYNIPNETHSGFSLK